MPDRHVLVVDDERLVRWSLSERLRADGFVVTEASSVESAIDALAKAPDAVILDYQLPDGDGLAVLKRVRQTDPDLPVVMLTAHKDAEIIVAAMKAGASDYVTKPFEVNDVALRVTRALELTRSTRELRRLKDDLARPFGFASTLAHA